MISIEYHLLSQAALDGLLSKIVLREGTAYGDVGISFEDKKKALLNQLKKGYARIICDPEDGRCEIMRADDKVKKRN